MKNTKDLRKKEIDTLKKVIEKGKQDECYNLDGWDNSTSLDELNDIRDVIYEKLGDYVGGTSIEGNGVNFNFTFNKKPFLLRIDVDEFHTKFWKEQKIGYWSKEKK